MIQVHLSTFVKLCNFFFRFELRVRYLPLTTQELFEKDKNTFMFYYEQVTSSSLHDSILLFIHCFFLILTQKLSFERLDTTIQYLGL